MSHKRVIRISLRPIPLPPVCESPGDMYASDSEIPIRSAPAVPYQQKRGFSEQRQHRVGRFPRFESLFSGLTMNFTV